MVKYKHLKQFILICVSLNLLCLTISYSSQTQFNYLNWGIAQDYPGDGSYSDVQTYSLGVQAPINKTFDLFAESGGWKDPGHYKGATAGGFIAAGLVLDLEMNNHYASYSLGPSLILPTDTLLGYPLEFYHKLVVGFRQDNKRVGIGIKHFSDAGISSVNYGRNFVFLEVGF